MTEFHKRLYSAFVIRAVSTRAAPTSSHSRFKRQATALDSFGAAISRASWRITGNLDKLQVERHRSWLRCWRDPRFRQSIPWVGVTPSRYRRYIRLALVQGAKNLTVENIGKARDRIQRCPQFITDVCDKLGFHLIGHLQCEIAFFQRTLNTRGVGHVDITHQQPPSGKGTQA